MGNLPDKLRRVIESAKEVRGGSYDTAVVVEPLKRRRFVGERKNEALEALEATASGVADANTEECESLSDGAWDALAKLTVHDLLEVEVWLRKVREFNLKTLREKLED